MRTRSNIARHELIGLEAEVLDATDKGLKGIRGTIVDETRNMLIIEKEATQQGKRTKKEVSIPKKGTTIRVRLDGQEHADIECDKIMFRSEDRIKRVRR